MSKAYAKSKGRSAKSPPFVALRRDMIRSHAFLSLSPHATKLLIVIAVQYQGSNNGSLAIPFEAARAYGFTNKRTYYATLRELEAKGFIERTKPAVRRGKPTATRYAITWQPIDEPVGEVKHDASPTTKPSNQWLQWTPERVAEVPLKRKISRGTSATNGGAEVPPKPGGTGEPRGTSATYEPDLARSREADLPPVYRSTKGEEAVP